jgi:hypothetical protein
MMSIRKITSVQELRNVLKEVCTDSRIEIVLQYNGTIDYNSSVVCEVPCDTPFELLTVDEIAALNEFASDNTIACEVTLTSEIVDELLGLSVCNPAEVAPWAKLGDSYYCATRNGTNRQTKVEVAKAYSTQMVAGRWAVGVGVGQVNCLGDVTSLAHRALAFKLALLSGLKNPVRLRIDFGCPPQFANVADTGRPNTRSDVFSRDVDILPDTLWQQIAEVQPDASDRAKMREKACVQLNTLLSNLNQRMNGKDVHAGGGSKFDATSARELRARFDRHSLDKLVLECVFRSVGPDGKPYQWASMFAPNLVALAIVLLSNRSPNKDGTLTVDSDITEQVLTGLSSSSVLVEASRESIIGGPYAPALLEAAKQKRKTIGSLGAEHKMDILVGFLSTFPELPSEVKASWDGKRSKPVKGTVQTYRCFGGIDIGIQAKA